MNDNRPLYVFVNQCMSGIGGGQRYVLAKARWLVEQGWQVAVCHVKKGEDILSHEGILYIDIPELRAAPSILGKKRVSRIVERVLSQFPDAPSVYVESAAPYLGLWGEEIAKVAGGKHLCFVLEETPKVDDVSFLYFKRNRHELAFIKNSIAQMAFGDYQGNAQDYNDCVLDACTPSPIEDLPFMGELIKADYIIGCISRLEKPAVKLMLDGIVSFCKRNPSITMTVVLVGDTPYESVKGEIVEYDNRQDNLNVQLLGYLAPIPRQLIEKFDLFIGKAGAASICAEEGVPTIRYTLDTDEVAGFDRIIEVKGEVKLQRAESCDEDLPTLLDFALCRGGLKRIKELNGDKRVAKTIDYSDHMVFIPGDNTEDYFDCWSSKASIGRHLASYWLKVFGNTKYEDLVIALRRHLGKRS